ncbi:necrosis inducing protein-domain-containing protein [Zopfochytrium polystomum]|nr:necrosis inducing protein-domain-containing protein [Zopfochytrium polystomum]
MYAWYWPKDQEAVGVGHRHDWESTVVFINDVNAAPENQKIIEVAASAHGAFRQYNPPNPDTMEGTHVHIKYFTGGIKDHSTDTWDNPTLGESPNYDFGNANFPLRDPNFMDNLAKAYI